MQERAIKAINVFFMIGNLITSGYRYTSADGTIAAIPVYVRLPILPANSPSWVLYIIINAVVARKIEI